MKSYVKKLFFFIIPLALLFILVEYSLRNIKSGYEIQRNDMIACSDSTETLILGNSHERNGINPLYLKKPAYNLAFGSQTLLYDKQLLLKYISILHNLKYVIIGYDYPSLYWGFSEKRDFFYYHYYGINLRNKNYYKEYLSYFYYVYSPKVAIKLLKMNFKSYTEDKPYKGWLSYDTTDFKTLTDEIGKQVVKDFDADIKQSIITKEHEFICSELESLIIFLKQKNITPILVTTPCYKYFTDNLDKNTLTRDSLFMNKLKKKYNVKYINSLRDTSFKKEHFYNCDHLNISGAKKYSLILDNFLNEK